MNLDAIFDNFDHFDNFENFENALLGYLHQIVLVYLLHQMED